MTAWPKIRKMPEHATGLRPDGPAFAAEERIHGQPGGRAAKRDQPGDASAIGPGAPTGLPRTPGGNRSSKPELVQHISIGDRRRTGGLVTDPGGGRIEHCGVAGSRGCRGRVRATSSTSHPVCERRGPAQARRGQRRYVGTNRAETSMRAHSSDRIPGKPDATISCA